MGKWIIKWYKEGRYTPEKFKLYVRCGWVTPEQYKELTGIEYTEEPQA
ncbi:XkdX family protein [Staphylococcus sp. NRL 19/737]|nr:XkdX family protein [Staphylococcus sp. NRL 19/737]MCJ1667868.1 XkdX family protein [Staphylococcus sp. NRL 19/737]